MDNGALRFYHGDHLGSSNLVTDGAGTQLSLLEYSPFGEVSRQSGSYSTDIKFTGKIQDDTGLYYYGARYYDPVIGRFITPDTIVQAPQDPQTLNRYAYCRNNPVKYIDPSGYGFWKKFWGQIVSAVVGIATLVTTWNPLLAFQAYSYSSTILSTGQALASGADVGKVLGSLAAGLAIGIAGVGLGIGEIGNLGMRMGAFALEGAAIGAAGSAIMGGDIGIGAAWGAGFGAATGFLSSQQFTNLRNHGEFMSDKDFANFNQRLSDMADSIYGGIHEFSLLAGEAPMSSGISSGHAGMSLDSYAFGKYPAAEAGHIELLFGKTVPGEIRSEPKQFVESATRRSFAINNFQYSRVVLQSRSPGIFALSTNCTPFALDTARFIGINVPSNLTTYGIVNPAKVKRWAGSLRSWSADK